VDGLTLGRKANRWKIGELAAPMKRKGNEQKCRPEDGKVVYVFDNDDKKVVEGRVTARMENSEKGRSELQGYQDGRLPLLVIATNGSIGTTTGGICSKKRKNVPMRTDVSIKHKVVVQTTA
jgi:hypothetical protein